MPIIMASTKFIWVEECRKHDASLTTMTTAQSELPFLKNSILNFLSASDSFLTELMTWDPSIVEQSGKYLSQHQDTDSDSEII